jgi:hypothetical protein
VVGSRYLALYHFISAYKKPILKIPGKAVATSVSIARIKVSALASEADRPVCSCNGNANLA